MATKRFMFLLGSCFACTPEVALSDSDNKLVDCTKGHSIQKAIDKRNPDRSLTLTIRGTCNEDVTIDRDDLALVGEAGSKVSGTITVPGSRRVLLRNMRVSSPTGAGVVATDNAAVRIEDSFLELNATDGLAARSGAYVTVRNSQLNQNGQAGGIDIGRGVEVRNSGSVDIANSTIANNRSDGVGVFQNSYARLTENVIEGNGRRDAGEAAVQVNRSRARANGNIIRNNTGIAALLIANHADYRTGSGLNTVDFPDNEYAFEQIQHPVGVHAGQALLAVDVNNSSYGDFRQVNIVGSVSAGDHSYVNLRGDQVPPNTPCSTVNTTGGFLGVSGRHGLLRLRGVQATPPVAPGQITIFPFGLREADAAVCP